MSFQVQDISFLQFGQNFGFPSVSVWQYLHTVPELAQHVDWWGHHMRGGARTGKDPATAVFNK